MGNVLVHAQALPSTPSIPTRIPDEVLRTLDFSPSQLSDLPVQAQQEAARRQAEARTKVLETLRNQNPANQGGIALPEVSSTPTDTTSNNDGGSNPSASPTPAESGQSPLSMSLTYLSASNGLTQANIAQTLALATSADIQLWKGYYEDMYDQVEETKRSYERVRDSLRSYKRQLARMLDQLPTTILSCL